MAQIDPLLERLLKRGAQALLLQPGKPAMFELDGAMQPVSRGPLGRDLIFALLTEIAPATERGAVAARQAAAFTLVFQGAPIRVELDTAGAARIRRDSAPESEMRSEAAAAPSPPRVSAGAGALAGAQSMVSLLHALVERRASDLHVSSDARPRLRVDGDLVELEGLPVLDPATVERLLFEIVPDSVREEFTAHGDVDFAYELGAAARIRCNLFRDRRGAGGVFRVIPTKIVSVEDLNLSSEIRELCRLSRGLVLVTGPTGSGKSTTLAALVDHVNRTRHDHIITIEDPIEFVHPNKRCLVNQREVASHTRDFKTALRAALREDPDIVMVGELRDLETIAIALETAETGHLVFGTLHTNSAVSSIDRLIDQFPSDQQPQIRVLLSESLKAVISQVLCKRIGGGRVAALEVLMVNAAVANLIRDAKTFQIPSLMQTGKKLGMVPLNDALVDLVKRKLVTPLEAYARALDKGALLSLFRSQNVPFEAGEPAARAPAAV